MKTIQDEAYAFDLFERCETGRSLLHFSLSLYSHEFQGRMTHENLQ